MSDQETPGQGHNSGGVAADQLRSIVDPRRVLGTGQVTDAAGYESSAGRLGAEGVPLHDGAIAGYSEPAAW